MKMFVALVACGAAMVVTSSAALADCAPFTAYSAGESRRSHFHDADNDGSLGVGDKRFGVHDVTDAGGNELGQRYAVLTVKEVDESGQASARSVDMIFALKDGAILTTAERDARHLPLSGTPDNTAVSIAPPASPRGYTVVGGTGAYAGATGTLTAERHPKTSDYTWRFDIACR